MAGDYAGLATTDGKELDFGSEKGVNHEEKRRRWIESLIFVSREVQLCYAACYLISRYALSTKAGSPASTVLYHVSRRLRSL